MTPQFTASAYVQIIDEVKRQDVCETLDSLGYNEVCSGSVDYNYVIIIHGDYAVDYKGSVGRDVFNCSDDISLFLELAQMRSDTDKEQWFIEDKIRFDGIGGQIVGCEPFRKIGERIFKYERDDKGVTNHINECNNNGGRCFIRRATPQEVYEHLKKR